MKPRGDSAPLPLLLPSGGQGSEPPRTTGEATQPGVLVASH